jgi:beta-glucanase (GH16 family)
MKARMDELSYSRISGSHYNRASAGSSGRGFAVLFFMSVFAVMGCGSSTTGSGSGGGGGTTTPQVATPTISTAAAQNGAQIVSMSDSTANATIYYTMDGTVPTSGSQPYLAPFLVASAEKVQSIAVLSGDTNSAVASQSFTTTIPSGTLVWSDEFANTTGAPAEPNPAVWTYDTGAGGWGNAELEDYCAWGSNTSPCSTATPNAFVDTSGYLNIVAEQTASGGYTSARLKTEGLFSLQYGRLEFRASVPEAQGFWPAAWMLGNTIATVNWPDCGEQDILERVDAPTVPDFNEGSVHGPGFTGTSLGTAYSFPTGETASTFHTYGIIWSPGSVSYYVDDPTSPYVTYTPTSLPSGATWPFDSGQSNFIILNLAVGGSYPGSPTASTPFPSTMLVDYVRLYTN